MSNLTSANEFLGKTFDLILVSICFGRQMSASRYRFVAIGHENLSMEIGLILHREGFCISKGDNPNKKSKLCSFRCIIQKIMLYGSGPQLKCFLKVR